MRDPHEAPINPQVYISVEITKKDVEKVLKRLPNGKAPGPDGIPNEVLKELSEEILERLAHAISQSFARGALLK